LQHKQMMTMWLCHSKIESFVRNPYSMILFPYKALVTESIPYKPYHVASYQC